MSAVPNVCFGWKADISAVSRNLFATPCLAAPKCAMNQLPAAKGELMRVTEAVRGLLSILLIVAPSTANAALVPGDASLRAANDQEVAAFLKTDATALGQLWSADFLVTNPLNKVASKDQVLGMVKAGMLSFKSYERRIEYIRHYGSMAVVIGSETVEWTGRMPLAGAPKNLRFTALWKLRGGRWQELIRHANIIPESTPQPEK